MYFPLSTWSDDENGTLIFLLLIQHVLEWWIINIWRNVDYLLNQNFSYAFSDLSTGDEIDAEKAKINYGFDDVNEESCIQNAIKVDLDRPVFHQKSFNEAYQLTRPPPKSKWGVIYKTVRKWHLNI